MRQLLATVAVVGLMGLTPAADQKDGTARSQPQTCSLKVSGMFCGMCAKTVEKAAKKIDGVKTAKVDQPTGVAEIAYDPAKTNPEAIAKAISAKTPFKAAAPK